MPNIEEIKSLPTKAKELHDEVLGVGICEIIGRRATQEDAAYWGSIPSEDLAALTPDQIGHRLWTTCHIMNNEVIAAGIQSGTTLSHTVYDGRGNFITATLADAVSFAAFYDAAGKVLGVKRLTNAIIKPLDDVKRIEEAGGVLIWGRVDGSLAVARSIGDAYFQPKVCADASIDITNIDKILTSLAIDLAQVETMQIITTCDGFTEAAESLRKEHDEFLQGCLEKIDAPGSLPEYKLAELLAATATKNSRDNISIAIQSVTLNKAFQIGVYDGHGDAPDGALAAQYVAKNIGDCFMKQCALSNDKYNEQEFSVETKKEIYYTRDKHKDGSCDVLTEAQLARYHFNKITTAPRLQPLEERAADAAVVGGSLPDKPKPFAIPELPPHLRIGLSPVPQVAVKHSVESVQAESEVQDQPIRSEQVTVPATTVQAESKAQYLPPLPPRSEQVTLLAPVQTKPKVQVSPLPVAQPDTLSSARARLNMARIRDEQEAQAARDKKERKLVHGWVKELIQKTDEYYESLDERNAPSSIKDCMAQLKAILQNRNTDDGDKIEHFYEQLNSSTPIEPSKNAPKLAKDVTYLDLIKTDKSKSVMDFIIGIALLASCIFVLPAIIMIGEYYITGKSPFNLFKPTNSYETYTNALDVLKTQIRGALESELHNPVQQPCPALI